MQQITWEAIKRNVKCGIWMHTEFTKQTISTRSLTNKKIISTKYETLLIETFLNYPPDTDIRTDEYIKKLFWNKAMQYSTYGTPFPFLFLWLLKSTQPYCVQHALTYPIQTCTLFLKSLCIVTFPLQHTTSDMSVTSQCMMDRHHPQALSIEWTAGASWSSNTCSGRNSVGLVWVGAFKVNQ